MTNKVEMVFDEIKADVAADVKKAVDSIDAEVEKLEAAIEKLQARRRAAIQDVDKKVD